MSDVINATPVTEVITGFMPMMITVVIGVAVISAVVAVMGRGSGVLGVIPMVMFVAAPLFVFALWQGGIFDLGPTTVSGGEGIYPDHEETIIIIKPPNETTEYEPFDYEQGFSILDDNPNYDIETNNSEGGELGFEDLNLESI